MVHWQFPDRLVSLLHVGEVCPVMHLGGDIPQLGTGHWIGKHDVLIGQQMQASVTCIVDRKILLGEMWQSLKVNIDISAMTIYTGNLDVTLEIPTSEMCYTIFVDHKWLLTLHRAWTKADHIPDHAWAMFLLTILLQRILHHWAVSPFIRDVIFLSQIKFYTAYLWCCGVHVVEDFTTWSSGNAPS